MNNDTMSDASSHALDDATPASLALRYAETSIVGASTGRTIHTRLYPHSTAASRSSAPHAVPVHAATTRTLAVVAHPYKPLGGSQTDPIVVAVAMRLAEHVCDTVTFDACGSGIFKSSCTSDLLDVVHHYLPRRRCASTETGFKPGLQNSGDADEDRRYDRVVLIGYSHGTLCLPAIEALSTTTGDVRYVLISPLAAPLAQTLSLSWDPYRHIRAFAARQHRRRDGGGDEAMWRVLVVYGGNDQFSSAVKLRRDWRDGDGVTVKEYDDVDHFYNRRRSVVQALATDIVDFCTARRTSHTS